MVNPAFPEHQMVGVFNLELARIYGYLYQNTGKNFTIVHALDGYDEISLTGPAKIISNRSESMLRPEDLGLEALTAEEIYGGESVEDAAQIFLNVLQGRGNRAQEDVVCANAALAIATASGDSLTDSLARARRSLEDGSALKALKKLQQISS